MFSLVWKVNLGVFVAKLLRQNADDGMIKENKKMFEKLQGYITYAILGGVSFILMHHFSKDWYYYQYYFDKKIVGIDWLSFLSQTTIFKEPLYLVTAKFFGQLLGFSCFILVTTIVMLVLKLHFLQKITRVHYTISAFFYICFYLFLFEGTQLRVAYASSLVVMAFYLMQKERFFFSFLLMVIASQIHLTAIIFVIALPLYCFRSLNKAVLLLAIISPLFIVLDISLFGLLKNLLISFNPKYIFYFQEKTRLNQNSTGLYYYFIALNAMLLGFIFYYLKNLIKQSQLMKTYFSLALCGVIAMCAFYDYVAVGARLGELFLVTTVILLSYLYHHFNLHKMLIQQLLLICISLIYFSARMLYIYPGLLSLKYSL